MNLRWRRQLRHATATVLVAVALAFLADRLFPLPLPDASLGGMKTSYLYTILYRILGIF